MKNRKPHPTFGHLLPKEKENGQGFIWSVATKAPFLLLKAGHQSLKSQKKKIPNSNFVGFKTVFGYYNCIFYLSNVSKRKVDYVCCNLEFTYLEFILKVMQCLENAMRQYNYNQHMP